MNEVAINIFSSFWQLVILKFLQPYWNSVIFWRYLSLFLSSLIVIIFFYRVKIAILIAKNIKFDQDLALVKRVEVEKILKLINDLDINVSEGSVPIEFYNSICEKIEGLEEIENSFHSIELKSLLKKARESFLIALSLIKKEFKIFEQIPETLFSSKESVYYKETLLELDIAKSKFEKFSIKLKKLNLYTI